MVNCSCGKVMEKVPYWLESVNVTFICINCPNRTVKSITQVSLEPIRDPSLQDDPTIEGAMDDTEEEEA